MSEIARRYAEACFSLRLDPGRFADAARSLADCPPLRKALEDPTVDWREKERVLNRLPIFHGAPLLLNFYRLLARKGRMALVPEIAEAFRKFDLASRNAAVCELRCVRVPDEARLEKLRKALCRLHHRDEVLLDIRKDPELLGGVLLKIDGVTYDSSVRSRLRGMERQLQERRMI